MKLHMHSGMKQYRILLPHANLICFSVIMVVTAAVLVIRIRRIRMFLGLPDPYQLVFEAVD
jgi:hypothetical protein